MSDGIGGVRAPCGVPLCIVRILVFIIILCMGCVLPNCALFAEQLVDELSKVRDVQLSQLGVLQDKYYNYHAQLKRAKRRTFVYDESPEALIFFRNRARRTLIDDERYHDKLAEIERNKRKLLLDNFKANFAALRQGGDHLDRSQLIAEAPIEDHVGTSSSHNNLHSVVKPSTLQSYLKFLATTLKKEYREVQYKKSLIVKRIADLRLMKSDDLILRKYLTDHQSDATEWSMRLVARMQRVRAAIVLARRAMQRLEARLMRIAAVRLGDDSSGGEQLQPITFERTNDSVARLTGFPSQGWYRPLADMVASSPPVCGSSLRGSYCTWGSSQHFGGVHSLAAGQIVYIGVLPGFGNVISIDHGMGDGSLYGGIDSISVVVGEVVGRGQVIASYTSDSSFPFRFSAHSTQLALASLKQAGKFVSY